MSSASSYSASSWSAIFAWIRDRLTTGTSATSTSLNSAWALRLLRCGAQLRARLAQSLNATVEEAGTVSDCRVHQLESGLGAISVTWRRATDRHRGMTRQPQPCRSTRISPFSSMVRMVATTRC